MHILIDILGSIIIGGIVLLLHFGLIARMNYVSTDLLLSNSNGGNTVEIAQIIENDFYKIGYRDTTKIVFELAKENAIKFKAATDPDSLPSTFYYFVDTTNQVQGTENPDDRLLYRQIIGTDAEMIGIVRNFNLTYMDSANKTISKDNLLTQPDRDKIKGINIFLRVESSFQVSEDDKTASGEDVYSFVEWKKTFYPKNL